jgi:osmotically-inducible protein OsmY
MSGRSVTVKPVTELEAKLQRSVEAELYRDPRVDSAEIAVSVHDAAVTLRGTVGSLGAKRAAARAAGRTAGARSVHNELEVRLLTEHRRDDAELRARVLEVLSWNASVPDEVDAAVKEGVVTLQGTVDYRFQREEAEASIVNLHGVREIHDELEVRNTWLADNVRERIEEAFKRNVQTAADGIRIEVVDGTVTLEGTVDSWMERNTAIDAAWTAPGVQDVDDKLGIAG